MRKLTLPVCLLFFLTSFLAGRSSAQQAQTDSAALQSSIDHTAASFYTAIGQESRLYNGPEYHGYDRIIKGNALFPLDAQTWAQGEVTYDGVHYKGVPIEYDIYKDMVIVLLYNHFSMYSLLNERVHDFDLMGHHFVRISADSLVNDKAGILTGYYDQLYGGKTEVLARWTKSIQHSAAQVNVLETYFTENHDYYLRKGKTYYKVNSQSAFMNALKDKKPALQKYLRDNNMKFRQNPEVAMAALAAYYDKL